MSLNALIFHLSFLLGNILSRISMKAWIEKGESAQSAEIKMELSLHFVSYYSARVFVPRGLG